MAGIKTEGNTGNVNETDANGYGYVKTAPLTTPASIGGSIMVSENDAGTVTGEPYLYSPETTDDYRLRVGLDTVLDGELFNYTAQNTGKHYYAFTTMTNDLNANRLRTNAGGITTLNTSTIFRTHRHFPFPQGQTSQYGIFNGAFDAALTTNTTIEFGFFLHGTTPFTPTDGAFFRVTSAGFQGVRSFNGSETVTGIFPFTHAIGTTYHFTVSVADREVKFWIDDVLYGELEIDAATATPFASAALPLAVRHAIGGTAAGASLRFLLSGYTVQVADVGMRSMAEQCGSAGGNGSQGQSGATMGSTALFANSGNPTSAAGSNTAVNITGLGGIGAMNAVAGAATDYIATGYQVPAATSAVPAKTLVITGIRIAAANLGATVATTPHLLAWFLGVGATAVSLATADTASFATATTKAPRKIPLGLMSAPIGAVVGATYDKDIVMSFRSPIYVNPGEWVVTGVRQLVGTATASQSIWYTVGFDSHWE